MAPLPDDGAQPRSSKARASGASVVRMLKTLVANRCVEVEGTLLRVVTRAGGGAVAEARAVVLLDVYLPVAAWSGWQFPRSRTAAAAVFKHVRCVVLYLVVSAPTHRVPLGSVCPHFDDGPPCSRLQVSDVQF